MRFIGFMCILLTLLIFSCKSHEKKESANTKINEAVIEGALKRPEPYSPPRSEITELSVIKITGVLNEGLEGKECYITVENINWYILSTEENFSYLYGKNITVEGEGTIIEIIGRRHELKKAKVIEVHDRVNI